MKLSSLKKIYAKMYMDRVDITRHGKKLNEDGTTSIEPESIPILANAPCRISFTKADVPDSGSDDRNPYEEQAKIFCSPDIEVRKGDMISGKKIDESGSVLDIYMGRASKPLKYVTHQEFTLIQGGDA